MKYVDKVAQVRPVHDDGLPVAMPDLTVTN
jgi:hypothetical protein